MNNQSIGKLGEDYAHKYLIAHNYQIIQRNYHTRYGEIDLITKLGDNIVFIEVKTRTSNFFGTASESITNYKRQNLIKTALKYLQTENFSSWRIDLITVELRKDFSLKLLDQLKNILDG